MPGMNRTGPEGLGPMTGRGMGYCGSARGANPVYGRGLGRGLRNGLGPARGFGFGFGWGNGFGLGRAAGPGRGLGWFRAGYSGAGYSGAGYSDGVVAPVEDIKSALEDRAAFLRAELARTEDMLGATPRDEGRQDSTGDEGK